MIDLKPQNLACLTGLRGVAALIVVFYHYLQAPTVLTENIVSPYAGYLGVDLFFLLSGFLMALNYGPHFNDHLRVSIYLDFLGKRLARVYPLYIFMTLLVFILSFWNIFQAHVGWKLVVVNILLAQQLGIGWARPYLGDSILGGAWSISTEFGAYLLFPLLYLFACRKGRIVTTIVLIVCFFFILAIVLTPGDLKPQQLPSQGDLDLWSGWSAWPLIRCLSEFTIGLCLWRLVADAPDSRIGQTLPGLFLASAVILAGFSRSADFIAVMAIAGLIAHLAYQRSRLSKWLASRPMIWLGEVSYAVYLLHVSLIDLTYEHPSGPFNNSAFHNNYFVVLAVTFLLLLVLAQILYVTIERPARKWVRTLLALPAGRPIDVEPAAP